MVIFGPLVFCLFCPSVKFLAVQFSIYSAVWIWPTVQVRWFFLKLGELFFNLFGNTVCLYLLTFRGNLIQYKLGSIFQCSDLQIVKLKEKTFSKSFSFGLFSSFEVSVKYLHLIYGKKSTYTFKIVVDILHIILYTSWVAWRYSARPPKIP